MRYFLILREEKVVGSIDEGTLTFDKFVEVINSVTETPSLIVAHPHDVAEVRELTQDIRFHRYPPMMVKSSVHVKRNSVIIVS
jgi:hypothetical protein